MIFSIFKFLKVKFQNIIEIETISFKKLSLKGSYAKITKNDEY